MDEKKREKIYLTDKIARKAWYRWAILSYRKFQENGNKNSGCAKFSDFQKNASL